MANFQTKASAEGYFLQSGESGLKSFLRKELNNGNITEDEAEELFSTYAGTSGGFVQNKKTTEKTFEQKNNGQVKTSTPKTPEIIKTPSPAVSLTKKDEKEMKERENNEGNRRNETNMNATSEKTASSSTTTKSDKTFDYEEKYAGMDYAKLGNEAARIEAEFLTGARSEIDYDEVEWLRNQSRANAPDGVKGHYAQREADNQSEKKYGLAPTPASVKNQAQTYYLQSGESETAIFLANAVNDGKLTYNDATDIYKNLTGKSLTQNELSSAVDYYVAEGLRSANGGTPVWFDSASEKLYGNYTPEQASKKLAELDSKESLTPQEENDFVYLAKKYPEIALDLTGNRYSELKTSYDSEVAEIEKQISAIKKEMNFKSKAHELTPERRKELEAELKSLETKKKKLSTNLSKEQQKTALDNRALEFTVLSSVNDENFENYVNKGNNKNYKDFGSRKFYSAGDITIESPDKYRAAAIALAEHNGKEVNLNGVNVYEIEIFRKMSDKEFETFAYWLGKDEEKAKKYIDSIEEQLVYRRGADIAKDADKWYEKLDLSLATGLEDTMLGIERNFKKEDYYAPSPNQAASYLVGEKLKKEGKTGQKTFYEGARTISAMAPSILVSTALSLAVPGAGAVTMAEKAANYIPKIAGLGVLGTSARGNAYAEMINAGYTEKEANAYGNLVAASEIGLEFLMGGMSKLGGISPRVAQMLEKTDNVFARMAVQFPTAFGGEFAEEGLQAFLEPYYKNMALGYDTGEKAPTEEVLYNALLGGFVGLFFESPEIITTNGKMYLADKTTGRRIYLNQNTEAFLEEAKRLGVSQNKIDKISSSEDNSEQGEGTKVNFSDTLEYIRRNGGASLEDVYKHIVSKSGNKKLLSEIASMTPAERVYLKAGAQGLSPEEASIRAEGMKIDQTSAWNAWEKGNAEFKKGNSENLDLLIEATDYLDRTGESGIMSDFAEETDIDKSGNKEYTKEQRAADIQAFVKGEKTFDETLDAYAHLYSELVNSNKIWKWRKSVLGYEKITRKQQKQIKKHAQEMGLIPEIYVKRVKGLTHGYADFASAGLEKNTFKLPEEMWLWSDKRQFAWLNEQIGGKVPGYTWHHSEIPGVMQLVPTGIHRITPHNGGRSPGMWAYIGKNRNGGK